MRAHEAVQFFKNAAAGTSASFALLGGQYQLDYLGTGTGTADVYRVGPDGSTGIKVATQITTTSGTQLLTLPPGIYYAVVATFTANYMTLVRVPTE